MIIHVGKLFIHKMTHFYYSGFKPKQWLFRQVNCMLGNVNIWGSINSPSQIFENSAYFRVLRSNLAKILPKILTEILGGMAVTEG